MPSSHSFLKFETTPMVKKVRQKNSTRKTLAAVYVVGLFGFIIWFGLIISWMFFGGVHPPIVHP